MTTETANKLTSDQLDQLCINTIRFLSVDGVQKANSGHPGAPMGMAAIAYTLWTKHLRFNPKNPDWANRDRFILSNGHASMLIYSLLFLGGYDGYCVPSGIGTQPLWWNQAHSLQYHRFRINKAMCRRNQKGMSATLGIGQLRRLQRDPKRRCLFRGGTPTHR